MHSVFLVSFVVFHFNLLGASSQNYSKPHILSTPETILQVGDNFTVLCEGNSTLQWTWPKVNSDVYKNWTTVQISEVHPQNTTFKYASRMFLQNATHPFTGFYKCSNKIFSSDSDNTTSIYVYVKDENHLSVESDNDEIVTIVAKRHSAAVIPCRPTSPDIDVKLTPIDEEKDVPLKNGTIYRYNPYIGFIINHTHIDQKLYLCTFTENSNTTNKIFTKVEIEPEFHAVLAAVLRKISASNTMLGEKLILECRAMTHQSSVFQWTVPNGKIDGIRIIKSTRCSTPKNTYCERITVHNTTISDSGVYSCAVTDLDFGQNTSSINVTIKDNSYINLSNFISVRAGEPYVDWSVYVDKNYTKGIYFHYLNNRNRIIKNSTKYVITVKPPTITLRINKIRISDFGKFSLYVRNKYNKSQSISLFLSVTAKPSVNIKVNKLYKVNEISTVQCTVSAYPTPTVRWFFKPCLNHNCHFNEVNETFSKEQDFKIVSYLSINETHSGSLKCEAANNLGKSEDTQMYLLTDLPDIQKGFGIFCLSKDADFNSKTNTVIVAVEETVKLLCSVSKYYYKGLEWHHNGTKLSSNKALQHNTTKYSTHLYLTLTNLTFADSGYYSCDFVYPNRSLEKTEVFLRVSKPSKPVFGKSNMDKNIKTDLHKKVNLLCNVSGIPKPSIKWFKNNKPLLGSEAIHFSRDNTQVFFDFTVIADEGIYRCEAVNKAGMAQKQVQLKFIYDPETSSKWQIYIIAVLVLIVILATIFIIIKLYKDRKLRNDREKAGLRDFEEGAPENFNSELGITTQATILPYDKKWEFPLEKLKLKTELGCGAFGVVMEGEAESIVKNEKVTRVAVKMLNKNADQAHIKALVCELKILIHLGQHLNVLGLLGACTRNITKGELLMIVEYCSFGNMRDYLLAHKLNFINQIDPNTGKFNCAIGQHHHEDSGSNNNSQTEFRSYEEDDSKNTKAICTKDLLIWAFQVSRGMEYLVSRRVLHGDLAARNILLTDNNVIKISDFGLARRMCKNDNYQKKDDSPLPIKWLAIESMADLIFSTQSDVWSFGIVLWEFFSLARTPYPGIEVHSIYIKLMEGYRMEIPEYASKKIYEIMLACWEADPEMRPSFSKLTESIGCMLEDTVRSHYIDLNDPYLKINTQRVEAGQSDYFSILNPPLFENLSLHNHVKDFKPKDDEDSAGYLKAKFPSIKK